MQKGRETRLNSLIESYRGHTVLMCVAHTLVQVTNILTDAALTVNAGSVKITYFSKSVSCLEN